VHGTGDAATSGDNEVRHKMVLTNLTAGVTLTNASGSYLGNAYITVPGVVALTPGQSAIVQLQFNNPGRVKVTFTPVTYSGQLN